MTDPSTPVRRAPSGAPDVGRERTGLASRAFDALADRFNPFVAYLAFLAAALVVAGVFAWLFSELAEEVFEPTIGRTLDAAVHDWFTHSARTDWATVVATIVTQTAGEVWTPVIAGAACAWLAISRRSWLPAVVVVASGAGSVVITVIAKNLYGRPRPPIADALPPFETSGSYPSGHTLNAVVIAGVLAYLLAERSRRTIRILAVVVAVAYVATVMWTRLYLGAHWFTDVVGGALLGLAWLALVLTATRLYELDRARRARELPAAPPSA